jgi:hypothetical protein
MKGDWRYWQNHRARTHWRRWRNWTEYEIQADRVIEAQKRHFKALEKLRLDEIAYLKREISRLKFWDQKTP